MGLELIVERKKHFLNHDFVANQSGHRMFATQLDNLNEIADVLNRKQLTDFFDEAAGEAFFYEEIHNEDLPEHWLEEHKQWFAPEDAIDSLKLIVSYLEQGKASKINQLDLTDLINDLRDCLNLLEIVEQEDDLFSFTLII